MNKQIDVLAVMDRLIGNARTMAGLTGDQRTRDNLRNGSEARAAIAELIDAMEGLIEISEMACGLGMFGRGMPEGANGPLPRAIAALAAVQGPQA